jgi:hypothetical protein
MRVSALGELEDDDNEDSWSEAYQAEIGRVDLVGLPRMAVSPS